MASGRICPNCEREILVELYRFDGLEDTVDLAGEDFPEVDETDVARAEVEATVRLSCSCSYHDVKLAGAVSAFSWLPDEWEYEEATA